MADHQGYLDNILRKSKANLVIVRFQENINLFFAEKAIFLRIYLALIYDPRSLFKIRARDWSKSITCVLVTWQQRVV